MKCIATLNQFQVKFALDVVCPRHYFLKKFIFFPLFLLNPWRLTIVIMTMAMAFFSPRHPALIKPLGH